MRLQHVPDLGEGGGGLSPNVIAAHIEEDSLGRGASLGRDEIVELLPSLGDANARQERRIVLSPPGSWR